MIHYVTDSVIYVGVNDHDIDLFEGQYAVPSGMAYNSYVILDDKIAVMDTVDKSKTGEWLGNVKQALKGRYPDYLVVHHMEPDHAASLKAFMQEYPETTVVGNAKTFSMIELFFPGLWLKQKLTVKEGEALYLGKDMPQERTMEEQAMKERTVEERAGGGHVLTFLLAPMVHWPEVMMSYEASEKILFSADAFGKFGALDVEADWDDEARRYYIGIVGKYGMQVRNVLKKAAALDIRRICSLHGPVLEKDLEHYLGLYDIWSDYRPESRGICVCYASIYGHTREAVELLCDRLKEMGESVVCYDLARCDMAQAVADAFRYDRLVLASVTYNGDVFPCMKSFIDHLTERGFKKRTVAMIENGSWAPMAVKVMKGMLQNAKDIFCLEPSVTIKAAPTEESRQQLLALAEALALSGNMAEQPGRTPENA